MVRYTIVSHCKMVDTLDLYNTLLSMQIPLIPSIPVKLWKATIITWQWRFVVSGTTFAPMRVDVYRIYTLLYTNINNINNLITHLPKNALSKDRAIRWSSLDGTWSSINRQSIMADTGKSTSGHNLSGELYSTQVNILCQTLLTGLLGWCFDSMGRDGRHH